MSHKLGYGGLRTPDTPQPTNAPGDDDRTAHTATLEILRQESGDPVYDRMIEQRRRRFPSIQQLPEHQRIALYRHTVGLWFQNYGPCNEPNDEMAELVEQIHAMVMEETDGKFSGYEEVLSEIYLVDG